MAVRRKDDDPISRTRFRTDRMMENGGSWFFLTREGTVEGPFECREDANDQLEVYIRLAINGMLPHQLASTYNGPSSGRAA
jgi:hypothetical protein